ncbi:AAA family ATPase [Nonomuraea phyllanthi]|uniref:AAA family ATPase n=1 Tax=Nonomuraea phyllanthi TaxID=2219224 RepID=A0A5C4WJL5_9ACTN|nr:LuxR family transcriptional regulator [Nonomuraea phyllanthi]KAB8194441.1 AAA family ATPase [Nonomuraea phyllanthi]QFY08867.1 AAA family ATPase [Nonomuraea phyllanthi]
MLAGRERERIAIDRLLADAGDGVSGVLVIRGQAGIGKSALLDYAAGAADPLRVMRGTGLESEAEMPFAALHLLLRQELHHLDGLPEPQAQALRTALGLGTAPPRDRFLVGLAVLSLLTELSNDGPLLILIDDAQWLDVDSAQALVFAARRLGAEGIAVVFAAREAGFTARGLPELVPEPLGREDAAALLAAHALRPDELERVIEWAQGNPLALKELPASLGSGPVSPTVRDIYSGRIQRLPERARRALLVAAADDSGEPSVVLRAMERLGLRSESLAPAEHDRLVTISGETVTFGHPLIRAAAYHGAAISERHAVHRALADAVTDADRRSWHLAAAAAGADASVAAELHKTGQAAAGRGAHESAAAAYERAANLAPEPGQRGHLLVGAAVEAVTAGSLERAQDLAERAADLIAVPADLAALAHVQATVESTRGSPRLAARIRVRGAVHLRDPRERALTLMEAGRDAFYGGDHATLAEISAEVNGLGPPGALVASWARGAEAIMRGDMADGLPHLRTFVAQISGNGTSAPARMMAANTALFIGDDEALSLLTEHLANDCRQHGMIDLLPFVLQLQAVAEMFLGAHDVAHATAGEALRIAADTGQTLRHAHVAGVLMRLAAIAGDADEYDRLFRQTSLPAAGQHRPSEAWAGAAGGLLDLGAHDYDAALDRLEGVVNGPGWYTAIAVMALPDHVEAAVAAERPEQAERSLARFAPYAQNNGRHWARAVALRCRALLAPDHDEAAEHYAAAVAVHKLGGRPFERARTELLYGERLRRARHRAEARPLLRSALGTFERIGAARWAQRARVELRATGEAPPAAASPGGLLSALTPQEQQVVRLAATGASNRSIAAQLVLSHRTVGYHLYKAFPKLGITSRRELLLLDLNG